MFRVFDCNFVFILLLIAVVSSAKQTSCSQTMNPSCSLTRKKEISLKLSNITIYTICEYEKNEF